MTSFTQRCQGGRSITCDSAGCVLAMASVRVFDTVLILRVCSAHLPTCCRNSALSRFERRTAHESSGLRAAFDSSACGWEDAKANPGSHEALLRRRDLCSPATWPQPTNTQGADDPSRHRDSRNPSSDYPSFGVDYRPLQSSDWVE